MDEPVRVTVRLTDMNADEQQLDDLTRRLRQELLNLEVPVDISTAGAPPAGAKSVELAALGTLVITLSQSPALAAIVAAISNWLGQRRQRTVKLDIDGDVLELSGVEERDQQRLIDAWMQRHHTDEPGSVGGRHALIVANYDYQDAGLRRLRAPAHDAEQLARVLRDPAIGAFQVHTVLNESAPAINEAVEDFFADRKPEHLLLLYFSGHGVKDEDGELYFAAAPTKLNRLGATAVAADFVNRRMNRSRSRRIVLLLDCCYAGAFERGMVARAGTGVALEQQFSGRGRAVITASSAMEYAFEGQELTDNRSPGPSVFTSALIEGLETGDADRDQDGYIGLDELYDYVYERVRSHTPHQTPGKWTFDLQGDLHIARRGQPVTRPAPLPHGLQEAVDHPLAGVRAGAVEELKRLIQTKHAGLALAAKLALERLVDDDSRTVSAAAAAALGTDIATSPVKATSRTREHEPGPPAPAAANATAPEETSEQERRPEPQSPPEPVSEPPSRGRVSAPSALPIIDRSRRWRSAALVTGGLWALVMLGGIPVLDATGLTSGQATGAALGLLAAGLIALVCGFYAMQAMAHLTVRRRIGVTIVSLLLLVAAYFTIGVAVIATAVVVRARPGLRRRLQNSGGWRAMLSGPFVVALFVSTGIMFAKPVGLVGVLMLWTALVCVTRWALATGPTRVVRQA
jgi:hypothetical protein